MYIVRLYYVKVVPNAYYDNNFIYLLQQLGMEFIFGFVSTDKKDDN